MRIPILVWLLILTHPADAQSARQQAAEAMQGVAGISDILTNERMEETVIPFETADPDEASLSASEFEDRMFEIRTGDSDVGRAYGATVDSALTRPDVNLGDDPLALANDAVAASEPVITGLFQGDTCETHYDGRTYSATQQCTRDLSASFQSCSETRMISVDRTDTWYCIKQEPIQTRVCDRDVSWSCNGLQGQACMAQALQISGAPMWNSNRSQAELVLSATGGTSCRLNRDTFTIQSKDWARYSKLFISRVSFNGTAQILVNGSVLWTSGPSTGFLNVGTRDCGKRCTVTAAYAGNTWIEDCSATSRNINTDIDMRSAIGDFSLGPSVMNGLTLNVPTGASNMITVEVRRVNTRDTSASLLISQQSTCCSSYLADIGEQCR